MKLQRHQWEDRKRTFTRATAGGVGHYVAKVVVCRKCGKRKSDAGALPCTGRSS